MDKSQKINLTIFCVLSVLCIKVPVIGTVFILLSFWYIKKYGLDLGKYHVWIKVLLFINLLISVALNGFILLFTINIWLPVLP